MSKDKNIGEGGPKKRRPSGGAHLRAAGKKPILVGATPEEIEVIDKAARLDKMPSRPSFLLRHGIEAAKKIIKKNEKGD